VPRPAIRDTRPAPTGVRRWLVLVGEWIAPLENPSEAVYGMIVIGSLLAAESGLHDNYLDTFLSATIAATLYWVAHAYSTMLGLRLAGYQRLNLAAFGRALARDWPLVRGAAIPILALVVAWASGADRETAVTAAVWSTAASLVMLELAAGLRTRASKGELALEVGIGAAMGIAIIALKVILH